MGADLAAARREAAAATSDARAAASLLLAGDPASASQVLARAADGFDRAKARLSRPHLRLLASAPLVGGDVTAARRLAVAGGELARAGFELTGFLTAGHPPLLRASRIDSTTLQALETAVGAARLHADQARDAVEAAPRPLSSAVGSALTEAGRVSRPAAEVLTGAERLLAGLGGGRPFRMLVLFENGAELRATGGLVGFVATVTVDGGVVGLERVDVVHDLRVRRPDGSYVAVDAPADYLERYGGFLANTSLWLNVNLSPDFPSVAQVASRLYEEATGIRPDLVVHTDLTALGYLLEAFGPVTVDGRPLDPAGLATGFVVDSYLRFPDQAAQSAYLARVVGEVFGQVIAADRVDGRRLVSALRRAVEERRMAFWSPVPEVEQMLGALSAHGGLPAGEPGEMMVVVQNFAANKIDLFTRVGVDVEVGSVGCVVVAEVTVGLTNAVPPLAARLPTGGFGVEGRWWVSVYAPRDAVILGIFRGGEPYPGSVGSEEGLPVASALVSASPGQTTSVTVRWQQVTSRGEYRLRVHPQAMIYPARLTVNGAAPTPLRGVTEIPMDTNCRAEGRAA